MCVCVWVRAWVRALRGEGMCWLHKTPLRNSLSFCNKVPPVGDAESFDFFMVEVCGRDAHHLQQKTYKHCTPIDARSHDNQIIDGNVCVGVCL